MLEIGSHALEPTHMNFLFLQCNEIEICLQQVLLIRNACFKNKKECQCISLIYRTLYLFVFSLDKTNKMLLSVGLALFTSLPYCMEALDPLMTRGGPMQWGVTCMSNLGSSGGQTSCRANSSLSTLICFLSPGCQPQ